jgi:hypothetical protein
MASANAVVNHRAEYILPSMSRDYRKEYDSYHASPEQVARRSARNKARRLMQKRYGKEALRGKDVDHKNFNASDNGNGNLRLMDWRKNRSRQPKRS